MEDEHFGRRPIARAEMPCKILQYLFCVVKHRRTFTVIVDAFHECLPCELHDVKALLSLTITSAGAITVSGVFFIPYDVVNYKGERVARCHLT